MAFTVLLLTTIFVAFVAYPGLRIVQNYQKVRGLGLPILITPFDALNPVWALTQQYFVPIFHFLSAKLPPPLCHLFDFIHYSTMDWNFDARYTKRSLPFQLYSPAFFIVSPGDAQLIICDPNAAEDILSRARKDFIKSEAMYGPLEIFGPNVDTVNGEEWARHRRITAPPFNERNSGMVWKESLRQASGMLKSWIDEGTKGVVNTSNETMALALHVLTAAGFGRAYEFASGVQEVSPGYTLSYRDALKTVLGHLYGAIITSALFMHVPSFLVPRGLREVKTAVIEFKKHMVQMVEEERKTIKNRDEEKDNLMSVLLRSSQAEGKGRSALSDDEIFGNLFIYNVAGHDTTANTLSYAITILATNPKYQDWIGEEVNAVFGGRESVEDWEYEQAFPKLKRCLALMVSLSNLVGIGG
jgi:cytochrome P450